MVDSDLIYQKWKGEFESLLAEINSSMLYYDKTRKCKCNIEDCKHFEKERDRIFGSRINDLFNRSIKNSLQTFSEINGLSRKN